ncbi:MAG: hypothetical protein AAFW46_19280, partial [Pseudomonadota bacterium]
VAMMLDRHAPRGSYGWMAIELTALLSIALWTTLLWSEDGRRSTVAWLRSGGVGALFTTALRWSLDRLDRAFSRQSREGSGVAQAWSHGLLSFCLGIAIAYPMLSLLVQWAATGEAARLGGALEVIPQQPDGRIRAAEIGGIVVSIGAAVIAMRPTTPLLGKLAALLAAAAASLAVAAAGAGAVS